MSTTENSFEEKLNWFYEDRGINLEERLDDDLRKLPDFSELLDIKKASLLISQYIKDGKKIALYGDYDADGTTSVALFYHFLKSLNVTPLTYQPNRFIEGYGLHKSLIEKAIEDGAELMITFDCGIMNHESAEFAKTSGIPLIITDHHNSGDMELPVAYAVVNPNRKDQPDSPLKKLAGVGVSFALAVETRKLIENAPSVYPLLPFLAIGTIGDMVELNTMNAKLVRHGLRQFKTSTYPAIKAFYGISKEVVNSDFIGFNVAPLINAEGRLSSPEKALELLLESDLAVAEDKLKSILETNDERKKIQNANSIIVSNKIKKHQINEKQKFMVIFHEKLHSGVIGLLASEVSRVHKKPSVVFTVDPKNEEQIKGSIRTTGDFDIFEYLSRFKDMFISFGGHKGAGGLTIKKDDLEKFTEVINRDFDIVINHAEKPFVEIGARERYTIKEGLILEKYGPFGEGFRAPLIKLKGRVARTQIIQNKHLKIFLERSYDGIIFFNYFETHGSHIPSGSIILTANSKISPYNGRLQLGLIGEEILVAENMIAPGEEEKGRSGNYTPEDIAF